MSALFQHWQSTDSLHTNCKYTLKAHLLLSSSTGDVAQPNLKACDQQVHSMVASTFLNHHIQPFASLGASHKSETLGTALLQGLDRSPDTSQHEAAATGMERAGKDSSVGQGSPSNPVSQPQFLHIPSAAKTGWPI